MSSVSTRLRLDGRWVVNREDAASARRANMCACFSIQGLVVVVWQSPDGSNEDKRNRHAQPVRRREPNVFCPARQAIRKQIGAGQSQRGRKVDTQRADDDQTAAELKQLTRTQSASELLFLLFLIIAVVAFWIVATEKETPTSLYDSAHLIAMAAGAAVVRQWMLISQLRRKRNHLRRTLSDPEI